MPLMEPQFRDPEIEKRSEDSALSRRQFLQALLATGGGLAASIFLSEGWRKPMVAMGLLPAQAHGSPTCKTSILDCDALNGEGQSVFRARDTIYITVQIPPRDRAVEIRVTIRLHQSDHPRNGLVCEDVGTSNAAGEFERSFDMASLDDVYPIAPGENRLMIHCERVNSLDGEEGCTLGVDVID